MGAELDYRIYEGVSREEAERLFESDQRESAHRDGTSYSGSIGVMPKGVQWIPEQVHSELQALDDLGFNHCKWEKAMGVEFVNDDDHVCFVIGGWCSS